MNGTTTSTTVEIETKHELSKIRIYMMKFVFGMTFLILGYKVWTYILNPGELISGMDGIAYSVWAAYAILMGFGLRFPIKFLPLLLFQLFYKSIWILLIALPLKSAGQLDPGSAGMLKSFAIAIAIDLVAIPWPYVYKSYFKHLFAWKKA